MRTSHRVNSRVLTFLEVLHDVITHLQVDLSLLQLYVLRQLVNNLLLGVRSNVLSLRADYLRLRCALGLAERHLIVDLLTLWRIEVDRLLCLALSVIDGVLQSDALLLLLNLLLLLHLELLMNLLCKLKIEFAAFYRLTVWEALFKKSPRRYTPSVAWYRWNVLNTVRLRLLLWYRWFSCKASHNRRISRPVPNGLLSWVIS